MINEKGNDLNSLPLDKELSFIQNIYSFTNLYSLLEYVKLCTFLLFPTYLRYLVGFLKSRTDR